MALISRMPPSRLSRRGGGSSLAVGATVGDHQHPAGRDDEHGDGDRVQRLGLDREQEPARGGAGDGRQLARDRAQGERAGEQVGRDDLRRQRAPGRRAERLGDSGQGGERDEGPELVCALDRDQEQEPCDDRLGQDRRREESHARHPVGDLAGRQREQRQRHELGQPDQAEVECALVDRVDLPADCDCDHLGRKPGGEEAAPQPPEVAVVKRGRQLTPGGAEERHEAELCR